MAARRDSKLTEDRLREVSAHLRTAFALPEAHDLALSDLVFALGNPEVRALYNEILSLQKEQLERVERAVSRHAANDV